MNEIQKYKESRADKILGRKKSKGNSDHLLKQLNGSEGHY